MLRVWPLFCESRLPAGLPCILRSIEPRPNAVSWCMPLCGLFRLQMDLIFLDHAAPEVLLSPNLAFGESVPFVRCFSPSCIAR